MFTIEISSGEVLLYLMIRRRVSIGDQYVIEVSRGSMVEHAYIRTLQVALERHLPVVQNFHLQRSFGMLLCPMDMDNVQTVHGGP